MNTKEKQKVKKVVLAYSGGLDTSVIMRWLKNEYGCEVVTFTADLGQEGEIEPAREKAKAEGIKEIYIEDLTEEFVKDYVFPMFRANAVYEGTYLLGTSIARPLISKRMIEICEETGADAIAHGATGKGNDQVRFEFAAYALKPDIKVIAPWREWGINSRSDIIKYAQEQGIEVPVDKHGGSPYSTDGNLLHISYESKLLEDPWVEPLPDTFGLAVIPETAPDEPEYVEIEYEKGDPIGVNGKKMSPANILRELNRLGGKHGVGREDIVENRYVGMKVRGVYETPGGSIMLKAHRALETLTVDRECLHWKDEIMPKYATIIYNGYWISPEREMMQAAIDYTQKNVTGHVRLKLYKGNVMVVGRKSPFTLYNEDFATFEEDDVYNQGDAEGFIKLNSLRLRIEKMAEEDFKKKGLIK